MKTQCPRPLDEGDIRHSDLYEPFDEARILRILSRFVKRQKSLTVGEESHFPRISYTLKRVECEWDRRMVSGMASALILSGIGVLILIAWVAHRYEVMKSDLAKKNAFHRDRARSLNFIVDTLPTKHLAKELTQLIVQHIILHLDKALELDPSSSDARHRLERAKTMDVDQLNARSDGKDLHVGSIGQKLKDAKRALKILKEFVLQQHRAGVLPRNTATRYIKSLHNLGLQIMLEGLTNQAKHNLREGHTALAIHYYQLAMTELHKNNKDNLFNPQIAQLSQMIKKLKAQKKAESGDDVEDREPSALGDAWEKQIGDEEAWKVKNYYD